MSALLQQPGAVESPTSSESERRLGLLGTEVRLLVGVPVEPGTPSAWNALAYAEAELGTFHERLSRFLAASELSQLNRDPRPEMPASPLLRRAVTAGLWAAERSGGLVDPTLVGELEQAGYARSRVGAQLASLRAALAVAPPRRSACPRPAALWREIEVSDQSVRRPPGLRIELGGVGKGLAADLCAAQLHGFSTFAVDAGGDIVVGGVAGAPRPVEVDHPLADGSALRFELAEGAVATSGLATRLWRTADGFAHHLLDPSTGGPAWTGVVQATAVGRCGVEAETLAKTALLSGREIGLAILAPLGGALVLDDGEVIMAGPIVAEEER